jgi:DNA-binding transcriptional LysR family regulator
MNLATLRTLRAILEHKSFTAAGEAVGCSPSAVSLQVKQLEEFFGRPLFDRSTRQVVPTPFALEVAGAAADISRMLDGLRLRASVSVAGRITLGVITSMQTEILPRVIHGLRDAYPALDIRVPPLNDTHELLAELKAGRIDAAVVVRPDQGGSTRLHWRDIYRQPYVMLAPRGIEPLAPRLLLERHPWVAYDTSIDGGRVAARCIKRISPKARFAIELRSTDAIVAMIALGLGVTVVPRPRRPLLEGYGVREIPLGRHAPSRRISLACRKADADNRNIAAVGDALMSCVGASTATQ